MGPHLGRPQGDEAASPEKAGGLFGAEDEALGTRRRPRAPVGEEEEPGGREDAAHLEEACHGVGEFAHDVR